MNSNVLLALTTFGFLGVALWSCSDAKAHDWYTGKTTSNGASCCSGNEKTGDCKKVRAWADDTGQWHFIYDNKEYIAPEISIHPDEENPEPFQASACVYYGKVLCFWRKRAGG